ncbi:adenosine deaminase [Ideonella azotifigens]|nr:adenosine deaminase [Ideonella azotifigens]MCD2340547.1 adenosine deaminase [Ideonella azotifigens]
MPKVELHCHLFGTVRQQTFQALARKAQAPISEDTIEAFYTRGEKPVGVLRVLRALDRELIVAADDLYRLTREYLEDARQHGVLYAEFFWNPTGTMQVSRIPYVAAQSAIVQAIRDAERDLGIIGRLVPSIDREATTDDAVEMVRLVAAHRAPEVLGIGIDYNEVGHPPELFWEAYRDARRAGLKTTAHAGEFGTPWTHVETAIDQLQVDRVDHGYTVIDNPALVRRCIERNLVFTVVPTNSYYLRTLAPERWALDHPIREMVRLGLRVHPNTDDPTLHHVTPTRAWLMMAQDFGFDLPALKGFMLNGLDAAWMDDDLRQAWRQAWSLQFDSLSAQLLPPAAAQGPGGWPLRPR